MLGPGGGAGGLAEAAGSREKGMDWRHGVGAGQPPRGVPKVSSLRGREMMRQPRQQLRGVPGG